MSFDPFSWLWHRLLDSLNPMHALTHGIMPHWHHKLPKLSIPPDGIEICVDGKVTGYMYWNKG